MAKGLSFRSIRPASPIQPPAEMNIKLTPSENQLCVLLDECRKDLLGKGLDVECRIAGGWVRDKLLDSQSNDIDVALSSMMGVPFAEHFISFVSSKGLPVQGVTKIVSNPDQSKHLETAKTKLLEIDLDFVNLRSEAYAGDSRIPTEVAFGTPLEDALRRDITVNALFYNVHTRLVEDCTRMGLKDLRDGIIRTPVPPKETFRDDPLRVLRCIRFASRFGFDLVPELVEAGRDKEIQDAFASKISRERVGEEVDKMMKGRDPLLAIRLIDTLYLQRSLYSIPPAIYSTFSSQPTSIESSLPAAAILHALLSSPSSLDLPPLHPLLTSQLVVDKTARPRLFLAAALTPFKSITYVEKKKVRPAVEAAIREALKLGGQNHYLDGIPALFSSVELLRDPCMDKFPGPSRRVQIGKLLRNKSVHNVITGTHWTSSLLFSLSQELLPLWDSANDKFAVDQAVACVEKYNCFVQLIKDLDLTSSVDAKALLNGREVVTALGIANPGPWTGDVLERVIDWQLEHPTGSKDDCTAWLKDAYSKGQIGIDDLHRREKHSRDGGPPKKLKSSR